jgi:hypothetical protein
MNKMRGTTALAIVSGANPIPSSVVEIVASSGIEDRRFGAACERGQATPHAGTFARTGQ